MFRFKYFLFILFVSFFGIFSLCDAKSYTFVGNESSTASNTPYTPGTFHTDIPLKDYEWDLSNCSFDLCTANFRKTDSSGYCVVRSDGKNRCSNSDLFGDFDVVLYIVGNMFGSFSIDDGVPDDDGVSEGLLPNGVSEFTPIINGLSTSINEFIPYVVYVGLGVLSVLIGFFAIKWLLKYIKGNTLSVFSSRKKK